MEGKGNQKKYCFGLAGIKLEIQAPFPLEILKGFQKFRCLPEKGQTDPETVQIRIRKLKEARPPGMTFRGRDLLLEYYRDGEDWCCEAPGKRGPVVRVRYREDFVRVCCEINQEAYPGKITSVDKLMQLFPLRQMLLSRNIFLLHASQAVLEGKGILFTGRSGIGKSTQAGLWKKYRGAELVCNDRTALRKEEGGWRTYGFPIDGSSPVYARGSWRAGAIVVLSQGNSSRVRRCGGAEAMKALMEQAVTDVWNQELLGKLTEKIAELVSAVPVYFLACTPKEEAVRCLEDQLRKDGIL